MVAPSPSKTPENRGRSSSSLSVRERAYSTKKLQMGGSTSAFLTGESPSQTYGTRFASQSPSERSSTHLPPVSSPARGSGGYRASPMGSPSLRRARRAKSQMEVSQWTGRRMGGNSWAPAFANLLENLRNSDPSTTVVRCSDDPDGARLIPDDLPPDDKADPPQKKGFDTRSSAWQLVYGASRDADVEHLAQALKGNSVVQEIDLGFCLLGNDACQVLTSGMEPGITKLRLCGNGLGATGGQMLGDVLGACCFLNYLDLSYNNLGEKGTRLLVEGLQKCKQLQVLLLGRNNMTTGGAKALTKSMSHCSQLIELDLVYNGLKDAGCYEVI